MVAEAAGLGKMEKVSDDGEKVPKSPPTGF